MKIVIVGSGWGGCAAAAEAAKYNVKVTLLERTDMLLGTGLVGGIMRNNGRFTATEEMIAMGGGQLFQMIETTLRHKNISFPGHKHADLYDIAKTPIAILNQLTALGVEVHFNTRIMQVEKTSDEKNLLSVIDQNHTVYEGDVFIDTTGSAGPGTNCTKYGNGCVMCMLRCPSFGGRLSLTSLADLPEIIGQRKNGTPGAMSGSCKLYKDSLSKELIQKLDETGVAIVPIPEEFVENHLNIKACQQYALAEYAQNIVLLDTGHAKLMCPFYPLDKLHQINGFEAARYEDPYAGGKGNSIRFLAMCHRDNTMKVDDIENLFCAGEKAGLLVGHTEAIVTGTLAGYNAVKYGSNEDLLTLPRTLATGDAIAFVNEEMKTPEGLRQKYTFSGSVLFERMKKKNFYTTDIKTIQERVEDAHLTNVFA